MELKENSVARIILGKDNLEEWRNRQIGDSVISMFLRRKRSEKCFYWQEVKQDVSVKIYWSYWDALVLKDEVLFKKWNRNGITYRKSTFSKGYYWKANAVKISNIVNPR